MPNDFSYATLLFTTQGEDKDWDTWVRAGLWLEDIQSPVAIWEGSWGQLHPTMQTGVLYNQYVEPRIEGERRCSGTHGHDHRSNDPNDDETLSFHCTSTGFLLASLNLYQSPTGMKSNRSSSSGSSRNTYTVRPARAL